MVFVYEHKNSGQSVYEHRDGLRIWFFHLETNLHVMFDLFMNTDIILAKSFFLYILGAFPINTVYEHRYYIISKLIFIY